jgi:hypothetical protein
MKYRVTAKMASRPLVTYKEGDIIECTPAEAAGRLAKGYIEPVEMEQAKEDKQLRSYKRKGV